jgi:hypothetical protein
VARIERQVSHFPRLFVDGNRMRGGAACTPATGILRAPGELIAPRREVLDLAGISIAVDADDDFGGVAIATFPNSNLLVLGAMIDAVAVGSEEIADITTLDVALGQAVTASADFSGAGEDSLIEAIDAAALGVVQGHSFGLATPGLVFLPAAADNEVFLNVAVAVTEDATVAFTGSVTLVYIDLGAP